MKKWAWRVAFRAAKIIDGVPGFVAASLVILWLAGGAFGVLWVLVWALRSAYDAAF
ncbi:hypothetical protein [Mesorhizobium sp. LNJC391B00]|uniref:hypothetical protein n=1 Tax=Mesorhizobium sp. LNJC391B00 TaxID=1287273 RepID=UPI0003CE5FB6|nr:hypothetical protein [Mesorhizobium sp. LNJC391B00]ESY20402.1 hypothetical protein X749_29585 [Mesorhizobium sp. LNJC391B00]